MTAILWFWLLGRVKTLLGKWQQYRRLSIGHQHHSWIALLILLASLPLHSPDTQASEQCDAFSLEAKRPNTFPEMEEGDVTVIGHLPNLNYGVVVPGRRESLLDDVRRYIPDAFMTSSRLGDYVHAGAFETRREAETLSMRLKACKIRSRVVYFRNGYPI